MSDFQNYRVFGLCIKSELELPELFHAAGDCEADIVIRRGKIAQETQDVGLHWLGDAGLFVVPGVARYLIRSGCSILVEAISGTPARNVRLYLLGSAMGILLHQRGLLPLHANAVEVDAGAIAFLGPSGAGKSTLAMTFHDRGFRVIADDICAIRMTGQEAASVVPGLPRIRLWQEALSATGRRVHKFEPSYIGDEAFDKFDVPIPAASAPTAPTPLAALYILDHGQEVQFELLTAAAAVEQLFANTYRGHYVPVVKAHLNHWSSVMRLVMEVPVIRLRRPLGFDRLSECFDRILDHSRGHVRQFDASQP